MRRYMRRYESGRGKNSAAPHSWKSTGKLASSCGVMYLPNGQNHGFRCCITAHITKTMA